MYKLFIRQHNEVASNGLQSGWHTTKEIATNAARLILDGQVARNNVACTILVLKQEAELCISTGVEVKHTV